MADTPTSPESRAAKTVVKKAAPSTARTTAERPTATGQASAGTNPAGAAIRDAARQAEIDRLTQQRDELRERIGDAPTLEVLRAEVDALQQVAARTGAGGARRWTMSAGVAADLETVGHATDPATGAAFVRDGDRVQVTTPTGETQTLDMPQPSGAGESKPTEAK